VLGAYSHSLSSILLDAGERGCDFTVKVGIAAGFSCPRLEVKSWSASSPRVAFPFSITDNRPMTHNADGDAYSPKKVATFVWFEHTQLVAAFKEIQSLLAGRRAKSQREQPMTNPEQLQVNVLLASFLIHARSLRDFLFTPPRFDDDVSATHFLPDWAEKVEDWCPYFHKHRERLNKSLAHISYKRIEYEPNKGWDCGKIHNELTDAWNKFLGRLTPEEQDWFTAPRK